MVKSETYNKLIRAPRSLVQNGKLRLEYFRALDEHEKFDLFCTMFHRFKYNQSNILTPLHFAKLINYTSPQNQHFALAEIQKMITYFVDKGLLSIGKLVFLLDMIDSIRYTNIFDAENNPKYTAMALLQYKVYVFRTIWFATKRQETSTSLVIRIFKHIVGLLSKSKCYNRAVEFYFCYYVQHPIIKKSYSNPLFE